MNKLVLKYPILGSSTDYTKLSLTIKGVLTLVVSVVVPLAVYFGYDLSGIDFSGIIASIVDLIQSVGVLVGLVMTAWGVIRKFKK